MTATVSPELMRKAAMRQAQERAARDGVRCLVWSKDGTWYVRTDAEGEVEGARLEWVEPAPAFGGFVLLQPMGGLYRIPGGHLAGLPGLDQAIVWATRDEALQAAEGTEICLHTSRQPTPELVFSDDRDGSGVPFRNNPERRRQNRGRAFRAVDDTTEGERAALEMIERALVEGCQGCGMIDPCGHHYEDCTLLEQGDILIDRATGKEVGQHEEAQ